MAISLMQEKSQQESTHSHQSSSLNYTDYMSEDLIKNDMSEQLIKYEAEKTK
jgi:hypothetical protein